MSATTILNGTTEVRGVFNYISSTSGYLYTNGTLTSVVNPFLSGSWSVTTGTVLTAATATYSKVDKQVALSGTFTFATAATAVTITLPYAPDYGGTLVFGNLTFVFTSGSTTATVQSSSADTQTFQINYKTA